METPIKNSTTDTTSSVETPVQQASAQQEISSYLESISILILGIFLLAFPLVFTNLTTDFISLPKQIVLGGVALLGLLLFGAKMIAEGKVRVRKTPFDLPVALFGVVLLISSLLSVNRWDSIMAYVPVFFAILAYFLITNLIKTTSSLKLLISFLVSGAVVLSIHSILVFLKVYILPFDFTKNQSFSPTGSLMDQTMYLAVIALIAIYKASPLIKEFQDNNFADLKGKTEEILYAVASVILIAGLAISAYGLFTIQKPVLLPIATGFQTAFAAISQDTTRTIQSFLFGSGFGTYSTDFTRFKQPTFNLNPDLWSLTFFRSSNFAIELFATSGVLGLVSFIFILFTIGREIKNTTLIKENAFIVSLLLLGVLAFLFPFSFFIQTTFFLLLALFATQQGIRYMHAKESKYYDIDLYFVAFKKGVIAVSPTTETWSAIPGFMRHTLNDKLTDNINSAKTRILPVSFFIVFVVTAGVLGFFTYQYVAADILFQKSLVTYAANNGLETYNNQTNAIKMFQWRDGFYRAYSQVNLALANSIASSQPAGTQPSAQVQQTIYTLIQQSINAARTGTSISPLTSLNWQNLAAIYQSLIGFGQSADSFAIAAMQQAIALDPNNPQLYLNLGGIYYQLAQWDLAQNQFQLAVKIKPDFANAYYNIGHALEQKGDLAGALVQYQTVQTLVTKEPGSLKTITDEIAALQTKIATQENPTAETAANVKTTGADQPPLGISTPSAQLPPRDPQVKLPQQ